MSPAALAVLGLLVAIGLSMTAHVNVGLAAVALAWVIGVYAGGLSADVVITTFPGGLFLTLTGVTLLFAVARANGTLDILARRAVGLVRGNAGLLPVTSFLLAGVLATIGPGAIASVALVAPLAMPLGAQAGVPAFLNAIMIGTGANAGNLSPVSSVGAVVNSLMAQIGLPGHEVKVWAANFLAHLLVAAAAYALFGGMGLLRSARAATVEADRVRLDRRHWLTIGITLAWMAAAIGWKVHVGLAAFAAATVLILLGAADNKTVVALIPLDIILMVTGVSMLVGVLEKTGGMDLAVSTIARGAGPVGLNATIAFVTGVISTYSSTSGVVLPAFLPMVPGLVREAGGGDPLAAALSINVGSALVDVSPLSTLGALCVATVADRDAARDLFRRLFYWGLAMSVVGAALCGLFAGPFARL